MIEQLATIADLERLTGRSYSGTDERTNAALDVASALVRGHCGWRISKVTDAQVALDAAGRRRSLFLPCLAVTSVSAVTVGGQAVTGVGWTASGRLTWLPSSGAWWPTGGPVLVTYSGGLDPVPAQVKAVVCAVAIRGLNVDPDQEPRLVQESVGPLSWQYAQTDLPAWGSLSSVEEIALQPYRLEQTSVMAAS